jgi:hypothetical protein
MQSLIKPLLRPLPILGLSTTGILLATTLSAPSAVKQYTTMSKKDWPVTPYTPRHKSWPYNNASDFSRQDNSPDTGFYSAPRFVTHIDDAAIDSLRDYYDTVLPRRGRLLDFCSSWISHYPSAVTSAAESNDLSIVGMGMNKAELDANKALNGGRLLIDLNSTPDIASHLPSTSEEDKLDASTCVVSIDYLTQPVAILSSLLEATKTGGSVHLTISNRCFPTKAISRWLRISEAERLQMVGDFLAFAGWQKIEIVELSNGQDENEPPEQGQTSLKGLMGWMGMRGRDPLWVVRAVKGE